MCLEIGNECQTLEYYPGLCGFKKITMDEAIELNDLSIQVSTELYKRGCEI